jgi:hypothetical protein
VSKETRRDNEALAKDATTVAAAAGAAATVAGLGVGLAAGPAAGLAAAGAVGGGLAGMATTWLARRRERRWAAWVHAYFNAADDVDPALVEAELHAKGQDPLIQDVVLEGARALDEALADVTVPALARLTREYVSGGKPADAFFRGVRRVLADLSVAEFETLRGFIDRLLALDVAEVQPTVQVEYIALDGAPDPQLYYLRPLSEDKAKARSAKNESRRHQRTLRRSEAVPRAEGERLGSGGEERRVGLDHRAARRCL